MKGQAEVIGILVIIILLVLGALFLMPSDTELNMDEITGAQVAQSFLNTIMRTESDHIKVKDIIRACHEDEHIVCDTSCCDEASELLENALDATLETWNKEYELQIVQGGATKIDTIKNGCGPTTQKERAVYPIPVIGKQPIYVSLDICY